jgi:hypothetical protein
MTLTEQAELRERMRRSREKVALEMDSTQMAEGLLIHGKFAGWKLDSIILQQSGNYIARISCKRGTILCGLAATGITPRLALNAVALGAMESK